MHPDRIAELLAPFVAGASSTGCHSEERSDEDPAALSAEQLHHISTYIDLLLRWNARVNLTAVRDPEQIVTRHFGESLFAARHLFPNPTHVRTAAPGCPAEHSSAVASVKAASRARPALGTRPITLADLGSGAGFPGLPIKLWAPHVSLTLVESNHKKAAFLREVARALTLTDIDIQNARAESVTGSYDVVTLRAVERFDAILPIAARLLAPAGCLALLISDAQLDPARSALPDFTWADPIPIPLSRSRVLALATRSN
jgi:16S rRNA (guanine527-N7)-methyltransferase